MRDAWTLAAFDVHLMNCAAASRPHGAMRHVAFSGSSRSRWRRYIQANLDGRAVIAQLYAAPERVPVKYDRFAVVDSHVSSPRLAGRPSNPSDAGDTGSPAFAGDDRNLV